MSDNEIGPHAAEFATAIAASNSLTTLIMADNAIGAHVAEFAAAIAASKSLTTLHLGAIVKNKTLVAEVNRFQELRIRRIKDILIKCVRIYHRIVLPQGVADIVGDYLRLAVEW
eukprot:GHVL01027165.1.p1 GENE.GHVL01027165.1~~GHVL01027165.1.p1  ORF type:complete len:114 (+),score=13.67 GHVL01027165.1:3-344(+)